MTESTASRDLTRLIFLAGAIAALSHLAAEWIHLGLPWGPVWKASGIVVLGLFALSRGARLAGLGLMLCAAGDVLLELNGLFVFGMAAFGLGHACYATIFIRTIRKHGLNRRDIPVAVIVALIAAALLAWLIPAMGEMLIPSVAYFGIITLMVVSALVSRSPMTARLGALLFMVSDSLLASGLYRHADIVPGAVWITYAGAQILLAWGFVQLHRAGKRASLFSA
jgi:uncharacterized membrane protein YhhN